MARKVTSAKVDTVGMKSMMDNLPLELRLEASVALITFAVAEFGNVVLELGRNCPGSKSLKRRRGKRRPAPH